jgi:pyruvate/2-oxoglutarate dehydrogenase complex dihydrolipoamide acyltransferase (E2) component
MPHTDNASGVIPIDLYRKSQRKSQRHLSETPLKSNPHYSDRPLKHSQFLLNQTLPGVARQSVVENVQIMSDNTPIEQFRKLARNRGDGIVPSRFEIVAWAAVISLKSFPALCSRIVDAAQIRQFKNPNLGLAIPSQDEGLIVAVVTNVFSLHFAEFVRNFRTSLCEAHKEGHLATYHSLTISDLSSYGVTGAVPVIDYPASAALCVGRPYLKDRGRNLFQLSLSFDQRIVNRTNAAAFLKKVNDNLRKLANSPS